jgi:FkbM family methyltransferase
MKRVRPVMEALLRSVAGIPPLTNPRVRRVLLNWWRGAKRSRRTFAERRGSARYSRPGLHGMDRRLEPYLSRRRGIFIEAGANDGYRQSNTYFLERFRDWSGVLIEPIPELAKEARRERPRSQVINTALVAPDFPERSILIRFGGLKSAVQAGRGWAGESGFGEVWDAPYEISVAARTLDDVLEETGIDHVDFLSLDVEGYEPQALAGLDLDRCAPRFILVEIVDGAEGRRRVESVLGARYEMVEMISPQDYLYRLVACPVSD